MSHDAHVLAECAAAPDDDGPRLVWADLVGGERGELVVVQCDLARGDLSPQETARRRNREQELLEAHGVAWAGSLANTATRWSFRRGFIETARFGELRLDAPQLLLSTITVDARELGKSLDVFAEHARLRGLAVEGTAESTQLWSLSQLPQYRGLRALALSGITSAELEAVRAIVAAAPIEQLWLRETSLSSDQLRSVLDAAPRLTAFATTPRISDDTRPLVIRRRLHALFAGYVNLKALLQDSAETLHHLRCQFAALGQNIDWLSRFSQLRTLHIGGPATEQIVEGLARSSGFAALRRIRVESFVASRALEALGERFGSQLELLELPQRVSWRRVDQELLHHDPASMFTLGRPCLALSQPAVLARLPDGPIWDVPAFPAEDRVWIGREVNSLVRLTSDMVARRHAAITWHSGRHLVEDLGTANGTYINGEWIEAAELADGAALTIGDVPLRYFVGDGARQRAEAALAK